MADEHFAWAVWLHGVRHCVRFRNGHVDTAPAQLRRIATEPTERAREILHEMGATVRPWPRDEPVPRVVT